MGKIDKDLNEIVYVAIGRSTTALREGQPSPSDYKMTEISGQIEEEAGYLVCVAIGTSVSALRQTSTGQIMAEMILSQSEAEMTKSYQTDRVPDVGKQVRTNQQMPMTEGLYWKTYPLLPRSSDSKQSNLLIMDWVHMKNGQTHMTLVTTPA